jgi:LPXTG-site transpeptidase (sortase) family protein
LVRSFRRWLKGSNVLIALGVTLAITGVRGAAAAAIRLDQPTWDGVLTAPQDVGPPVYLPPTLLPTQTPTPFQPSSTLPGQGLRGGNGLAEVPTETPTPTGSPPERLLIPSIGLDAPVEVSSSYTVVIQGQGYLEWAPPDRFAAGWQQGSAPLGVVGNTVLNGHNNIHGDVFARLEDVRPGDTIRIASAGKDFSYRVANRMILPEKYEELAIRAANAQWIQPSQDERLTLVTCWPLNGNTHRLILVAVPA